MRDSYGGAPTYKCRLRNSDGEARASVARGPLFMQGSCRVSGVLNSFSHLFGCMAGMVLQAHSMIFDGGRRMGHMI